jgi:hypothetical protein
MTIEQVAIYQRQENLLSVSSSDVAAIQVTRVVDVRIQAGILL